MDLLGSRSLAIHSTLPAPLNRNRNPNLPVPSLVSLYSVCSGVGKTLRLAPVLFQRRGRFARQLPPPLAHPSNLRLPGCSPDVTSLPLARCGVWVETHRNVDRTSPQARGIHPHRI